MLVSGLARKRDFYAGGLMILFGLIMALKGPTYQLGTLMHMGPGFLPTVLGVILILLGIAIAGSALTAAEGEDENILPEKPEWLAWGCILASPLVFMLFGIGIVFPIMIGYNLFQYYWFRGKVEVVHH